MLDYARAQFADGGRRAHLESAARQGLKRAQQRLAEIEALPPLPAAVEHLWTWWTELHAGRRYGWGAEPLGWSDIESWARLTGARPRPAECRVLLRIDREWIAADAKRRELERKRGP